jgi:hypothetical protein
VRALVRVQLRVIVLQPLLHTHKFGETRLVPIAQCAHEDQIKVSKQICESMATTKQNKKKDKKDKKEKRRDMHSSLLI